MQSVDLTTCDREPIHIPGTIQPFGFLLVLSQDFAINGGSGNAAEFLGLDFDDIARKQLEDVFTASAVSLIGARLELLHGPDAVERLFGVDLQGNGKLYDLAIHFSGIHILLEAEPSRREQDVNSGDLVRTMLGRLRGIKPFDQFTREAARQLKLLSGFDRVMVYRFEHDGAGEVIAEAAEKHLESYLGLHYPASDIPKQARLLYQRNWLRIIADINARPVPLLSAYSGRHEPIDLSMSVLRAVSPIHIEYLNNMGVGASMSVSILREGKLWGLFACHHYSPRHIPFERRTAAELFGQMFSWILEAREREIDVAYEARARSMQDRMVASISANAEAEDVVGKFIEDFRKVIDCDGVGVWNNGLICLRGETPNEEEFTDLVRRLTRVAPNRVFAANDLGAVFAEAKAYGDRAAGVLAVPISRSPRDFLMFFRKEVARTVTWAGDPSKPMTSGPLGERLTPRKSFEAWQEVVRGQSVAWRDADLRIAESLRVTLLEVILRLADISINERKAAQERQELLIAELNHRVRNILSLIRGLVNQSRSTSKTVEEFAAVLNGRIQSLGRAHDMLTQTNWEAGDLQSLLQSEAGAYISEKMDRIRLKGPDIGVEPKAFSTLALVMHEMMTNSAKYGALCDSRGAVDVSWNLDEANRLVIEWRELGGPPVAPPSRRGFGTTIIERSIPFDLGGEAEISYDLVGVRARFVIPPAYVRIPDRNAPAIKPADASREEASIAGTALIVEDNLIIAVNGEGLLQELGATHVEIAASVRDALECLDKITPGFALLDINLGGETSMPVGLRLAEMGVPFIFATGYGDRAKLPEELAHIPVIQKPYTLDGIRAGIGKWDSQVSNRKS